MHRTWTREETIVAFWLYCRIPFNECNKNHRLIVKYADIIGRTPSALNMKIGNIGSLDPSLLERGISGLKHRAKMEEKVWNEFIDNPDKLAYESEKIISSLQKQNVEQDIDIELPHGKERETIIRQRVNQRFFSDVVKSSYNFRCCVSGIGCHELLEACHIVSWSEDERNRTNPRNGLCLNSFFHKAYDKFLIAISPDFIVKVSKRLFEDTADACTFKYLREVDGKTMTLPSRFLPSRDFLDIHYAKYMSCQ